MQSSQLSNIMSGQHATPAYPSSFRPPSPPHIHIPPVNPADPGIELPAYNGVGGESITDEDIKIITQVRHVAVDTSHRWQYEMRRKLQLILPFLYLGPSCGVKDRDFLRKEGVTMLLVVRNTRSAEARILSGDRVASELGIASAAVDVQGNQELIAAFPHAIKIINDHLLSVYREQALKGSETSGGNITIDQSTFRRGKVVVFCESGNERSACVVTAYIMKMYGLNLVSAIQFVQLQRFCIALDDDTKTILQSFHDILQAERDVAEARRFDHSEPSANGPSGLSVNNRSKRHIEDTLESDTVMEIDMDIDRFEGRTTFKPFIDDLGASNL